MLLAPVNPHLDAVGQRLLDQGYRLLAGLPLLALALLVSALGSTILPPRGIALSLMVLGVVLAVVLWRGLVRMHARLQAALKETLDKPGPS